MGSMNGHEVEALSRAPHPSFWNQLCALWIGAEYRAATDVAHLSIAEAMPVALERVKLVVAGEVRWSEAGAGDRAAWVGRGHRQWPRPDDRRAERGTPQESGSWTPPQAPPTHPITAPRPPRLHSYRERLWWNYYDTVTITGGGSQRAFGSPARIGLPHLTNLNTPGTLGDQFIVFDMYCVPLSPIESIPWDWIRVEAGFHNRLAFDGMLAELVLGMPLTAPRNAVIPKDAPGMPLPWVIPEHATVQVSIFADTAPPTPITLRIHLDGLRTREIL